MDEFIRNMTKLFTKTLQDEELQEIHNAELRPDGFWGFLQFYQHVEFVSEAEKSLTKPGQFFIYVKDNNDLPYRFDVVHFDQTRRLSFEINEHKVATFEVYLDRKKDITLHAHELIPYLMNYCKGRSSQKLSLYPNGISHLASNNVKNIKDIGMLTYGLATFQLDLVEFQFKQPRPEFPKRAIAKKYNLENDVEIHSRNMDEALLLHRLNQNSKFFVEVLGINYYKGVTVYYNYGLGSLKSILLVHRGKIGQEYKLKWAMQVAEGLQILKELGIKHRNFSTSPCFLCEDGSLKIGDLFLAKSYKNFKTYGDRLIRWLSPESLWNKEYSHESEVWSYGVVVWSIYSEGLVPYADLSDSEVKTKMSRPFQKRNGKHLSGLTLEMPKTTPVRIASLIESCWSHCTCCRPKIEKIAQQLNKLIKK